MALIAAAGYKEQTVKELAALMLGERLLDRLSARQVGELEGMLGAASAAVIGDATLAKRLSSEAEQPGGGEAVRRWLERPVRDGGSAIGGARDAPLRAIRSASPLFAAGQVRRMPVPMAAIVRPPSSAASCAAASIPSANPDSTVTSAPIRTLVILRARVSPSSDGRRVPTTATERTSSRWSLPSRTGRAEG